MLSARLPPASAASPGQQAAEPEGPSAAQQQPHGIRKGATAGASRRCKAKSVSWQQQEEGEPAAQPGTAGETEVLPAPEAPAPTPQQQEQQQQLGDAEPSGDTDLESGSGLGALIGQGSSSRQLTEANVAALERLQRMSDSAGTDHKVRTLSGCTALPWLWGQCGSSLYTIRGIGGSAGSAGSSAYLHSCRVPPALLPGRRHRPLRTSWPGSSCRSCQSTSLMAVQVRFGGVGQRGALPAVRAYEPVAGIV